MDLPQIGAHCSVKTCNILDLLPIKCQCDHLFCSRHITPDLHSCAFNSTTSRDLSTFADKLQRCSLEGCGKSSLKIYNGSQEGTCSACQGSFCADHRHSDSHSCSPQFLTDVSRKNEAAEKKVADRPSSSALPFKSFQSRRAKIPTDPAKLAQYQKMQLMKMRHQAFPGDPRDKNIPIPPEQRLHVRMVIEGAEKVFWFRKTLVTGKALDLLSAYLKLVSTDTQLFRMCKVSPANEECIYLRNDRLLVDEIEDGAMVVICPKI